MFCRERERLDAGRPDARDGLRATGSHGEVARRASVGEATGRGGRQAGAMLKPRRHVGGVGEIPRSQRRRPWRCGSLRARRRPRLQLRGDDLGLASGSRQVRGRAGFLRRVDRMQQAGGIFGGPPGGVGGFHPCGQRRHRGEPLRRELPTDLWLEGEQLLAMPRQHVGRRELRATRPARTQDAEQRVVVGLADGIEFVVVAAGARHGQPEERLRKRVDLVVGEPHLLIKGVGRPEAVKHHPEVRRADRRFVDGAAGIEPGIGQQVAGDVLPQQLVEGHVGVERSDQVVTVVPRAADFWITLGAMGVGVADPVHPVAGPLLAEVRAGEEVIDQRLNAPRLRHARRPVRCLVRRWWQADDREEEPAHERPRRGVGGRGEPLLSETGEDVQVDRMLRPVVVGDGRGRAGGERLKRPPLTTALHDGLPRRRRREFRGRGGRIAGVRGAGRDPSRKVGERGVVELAGVLRHLDALDLVPQHLHQVAAVGIAGHDGGPRISAGEQAGTGIDRKPAVGLFGRVVAGVAPLHEHRADP